MTATALLSAMSRVDAAGMTNAPQVPSETLIAPVIGIVGRLIATPDDGGTGGVWLAQFLTTAPPEFRWAVVDTAVTIAHVLRDACTEMVPGWALNLADAPAPVFETPALARGATDAVAMIEEPGEALDPARWPIYAAGEVRNEQVVAVVMTACHTAASLVLLIASMTGRSAQQTWRSIVPLLV